MICGKPRKKQKINEKKVVMEKINSKKWQSRERFKDRGLWFSRLVFCKIKDGDSIILIASLIFRYSVKLKSKF